VPVAHVRTKANSQPTTEVQREFDYVIINFEKGDEFSAGSIQGNVVLQYTWRHRRSNLCKLELRSISSRNLKFDLK